MDLRELPPSMKNGLFRHLEAAGLDPGEFTWSTVEGPFTYLAVSKITHRRTGFFTVFDIGSDGLYYLTFWPGGSFKEISPAEVPGFYIPRWVEMITPEIKQPDLWQLFEEQQRLGTDPQADNTPFTAEEQKQIAEGLFQLEEHIYQVEPELEADKRLAVAARFRFLKDAAARLGRLDWMSMVVGQLFAMASERIIRTQTFHSLYNMAASVFGKVLQLGGAIIEGLAGG